MKDKRKIIESILARLEEEINLSTYRACKEAGIGASTFWNALESDPAVMERYARAKRRQVEAQADELIELADNPDIDPKHKQLMIDVRKFRAVKLLPKKYGDRLDLELVDTRTLLKALAECPE